jgi:hypothetical protein
MFVAVSTKMNSSRENIAYTLRIKSIERMSPEMIEEENKSRNLHKQITLLGANKHAVKMIEYFEK